VCPRIKSGVIRYDVQELKLCTRNHSRTCGRTWASWVQVNSTPTWILWWLPSCLLSWSRDHLPDAVRSHKVRGIFAELKSVIISSHAVQWCSQSTVMLIKCTPRRHHKHRTNVAHSYIFRISVVMVPKFLLAAGFRRFFGEKPRFWFFGFGFNQMLQYPYFKQSTFA